MAIAGGMLIFGGELNDFARRAMHIVLVAGILLGASRLSDYSVRPARRSASMPLILPGTVSQPMPVAEGRANG